MFPQNLQRFGKGVWLHNQLSQCSLQIYLLNLSITYLRCDVQTLTQGDLDTEKQISMQRNLK